MPHIEIPSCLDQDAPGVAAGLRLFIQHHDQDRLNRLIGDRAIAAWRDTGRQSSKWTWELSEDQLSNAQFLLAYTTYTAPDFRPIGHREAGQSKAWFDKTKHRADELASRLREATKHDHLIEEEWQCYRDNRRDDEFLHGLTYSISGFAKVLDYVSGFLEKRAASPYIKTEGPRITVVQQPDSEKALKRTVLLRIGRVCHDYFREPMYSVVETLASLTLDLDENSMPAARDVVRILWDRGKGKVG